MKVLLKWKFLSCFLLCLGVGLLLSVPAGAVDVSDPALDSGTGGDWRGVYGDCFVLLPDPKCTGFPEPEFGSFLDGVCTTELDDFVSSFDLRRDDGRPANTFWNTVNDCSQPESSPGGLCGTVAEQFGTCGDDFSMCAGSAQWNPCADAFKGTLWDEGDCFTPGGVVPPLISELILNLEGSTQLAYYFAAGCESSRTQNWWLYIDGVLAKSDAITVTGDGQYLIFQLADMVPGTVVRFETQNVVPTACNPAPPPPGGPPNNSVLSGVFLSNCEPEPKCSIGDFVFEDANRDGCQDPDEDPIEGVEVKLFEDCVNPNEIASTTTNADGFYEFTGLDCDKGYRVQFGDAGAIYERTLPDQNCSSTDPPEPSDLRDSDCAQDDGFTGCITFPDPVNNPNDPTIDCGYVCEGKIGDRVWLDDNEDGCQDNPMDEPGIPMVAVTLSEDCEDRENPVTLLTDENGDYEFTGLCPGEYFVEFGGDLPNTLPDQDCDNDPDESDKKDSNCGDDALQCVTLTKDNPEDPTIDCGKIPPPCEVEVTKVAQPDIIVCDSGTDGVDTGTNGTDDPCIVKCEDTGTDGDITDECIAETVTYIITVTNPGGSTVSNIMVDDEVLGFMAGPFTLGPGESQKFPLDGVCIKEDTKNTVVVTVDGELCDEAMAEVETDFECPETGDGEGCTPGYWKQSQHFDSWTAPYTPDTLFSDVFENAFPGKTLLEVLELGGGGLEALGRHTVAALLNAASSGVSYDLSVNDVIGGFNDVYPGGDYGKLKDIFERFNEQGCPLN